MTKTAKGKKPQQKKATPNKSAWIIGAVAVAAVFLLVAVSSGGLDTGTVSETAGGGAPDAGSPETDYAGRLLPAGYEAPTVADVTIYAQMVAGADVQAAQEGTELSFPVDALVEAKNVEFEYTRADGQVLPMLAYVRPSGKLFVGVNYCPPCEGVGQSIGTDGTLVCAACGTKRNLETNAGISGACKLYPLDEVPATVDGDRVVIDGTLLDAWTSQPLDRPVG